MSEMLSHIRLSYTLIGCFITVIGIWLTRAPRQSRFGTFLGPMAPFRLMGLLFILLGIFATAVGLGLRHIGPIPINVK